MPSNKSPDLIQYLSNLTPQQVDQYLLKIRKSISANRYRIDKGPKRQDNSALFLKYIISESDAKKILLSLTWKDFSTILQNEHIGYEHEWLYVFSKEVNLLKRFGDGSEMVPLYIKFNMLPNSFVVVISFHRQQYPLTLFF